MPVYVIRSSENLFFTNKEDWHREAYRARQYDGPRGQLDAEEQAVKLRRFGSVCQVVVAPWTRDGISFVNIFKDERGGHFCCVVNPGDKTKNWHRFTKYKLCRNKNSLRQAVQFALAYVTGKMIFWVNQRSW
jgi:hypothetical protein